MQIVRTINDLTNSLKVFSENKDVVGFVPTMGALHHGHLSLVEASAENAVTVVSIFVNPTQFNDPADFQKYPRTEEADIEILKPLMRKKDIVFIPDVSEIYPPKGMGELKIDFHGLDKVMEGTFRPGHFDGVAQVVYRLFSIVKPDFAYFGEKDFQQLLIIRSMTEAMNLSITIKGCPIIREFDGLAMSSRNVRLSPDQRIDAGNINRIISSEMDILSSKGVRDYEQLVTDKLNSYRNLRVEYVEVRDEDSLKQESVLIPEKSYRVFVAVFAGEVRLIDNMSVHCADRE